MASDDERSPQAGLAEDRTDYAEDRTNFAEDRTMLANERTFAGWVRTGLAAIGIGVGFHALFETMQPDWAPKAIATIFMLLGVFVVAMAERRACRFNERLTAHRISDIPLLNIRLIAIGVAAGACGLVAAVWLLY